MLNQYAVDIPTLPVNRCFSHLIQFLVECSAVLWECRAAKKAAKYFEMLFNAYREQVYHSQREGLSVGQSSSSVSDRSGQPVVETVAKSHDRTRQPVERKRHGWSNGCFDGKRLRSRALVPNDHGVWCQESRARCPTYDRRDETHKGFKVTTLKHR